MSKSSNKVAPPKSQSSLFSFFKKKSTPDVAAVVQEVTSTQSQPQAKHSPEPVHVAPVAETPQKSTYVVMEDNKSLYVGRGVRVFWPNEKQWYTGTITAYDDVDNAHTIMYDDGDQEDLCLDREKVTVIEN
jgi:hypothetical protein